MKLSPEEKAARKAAFRAMSPAQKLDHVFTYYKWPILLALVALLVLGSAAHRALTRKEPALYLAFANVTVGDELEARLLASCPDGNGSGEVYLYRDLYLSENADMLNHEYAYASRMKLMGAVTAGKLDLVLMNREAYDLLSQSGYLLELSSVLPEAARPYLTENAVVLSDNAIEYQLGEAASHEVTMQTAANGLDVSAFPAFAAAGFSDAVYLGVIGNTPRLPACVRYIAALSPAP